MGLAFADLEVPTFPSGKKKKVHLTFTSSRNSGIYGLISLVLPDVFASAGHRWSRIPDICFIL
jgi:hypothetical protein